MSTVNPFERKLADLQRKLDELQAKRRELDSSNKKREAKRISRRAIIVGKWLQANEPATYQRVVSQLTRRQDLAAFGLPLQSQEQAQLGNPEVGQQ